MPRYQAGWHPQRSRLPPSNGAIIYNTSWDFPSIFLDHKRRKSVRSIRNRSCNRANHLHRLPLFTQLPRSRLCRKLGA